MSGRAPDGSDRGPGVARCPLLPLEAADWVDIAGFLGVRKSFEVILLSLTFFVFDAAAVALGLGLGVVDFLEPLPPPPLPL